MGKTNIMLLDLYSNTVLLQKQRKFNIKNRSSSLFWRHKSLIVTKKNTVANMKSPRGSWEKFKKNIFSAFLGVKLNYSSAFGEFLSYYPLFTSLL